jgi:hypothetical protein
MPLIKNILEKAKASRRRMDWISHDLMKHTAVIGMKLVRL